MRIESHEKFDRWQQPTTIKVSLSRRSYSSKLFLCSNSENVNELNSLQNSMNK